MSAPVVGRQPGLPSGVQQQAEQRVSRGEEICADGLGDLA